MDPAQKALTNRLICRKGRVGPSQRSVWGEGRKVMTPRRARLRGRDVCR
jgi:hypothetical protein